MITKNQVVVQKDNPEDRAEKAKIQARSYYKQIICWERFYRENFNIQIDINAIKVPEYTPGYDWLIVIAKGITMMMLLNLRRRIFPIWLRSEKAEKNLDALIQHDRNANQMTYVVAVRDIDTPDVTIKKIRELEKENGGKKIPTITLLECIALDARLLLKNIEKMLYQIEKEKMKNNEKGKRKDEKIIITNTVKNFHSLNLKNRLINKDGLSGLRGVTLCRDSHYRDKNDIPAIFTMKKNECLYIYGFDREYSNPSLRLVKVA